MGHESEPRVLALHGLRLKGFAGADAVGEVIGLEEEEVSRSLAELQEAGLVQHREGRMSGYSLTATGRAEHHRLLSAELDRAGARDAVRHCYERFLALNAELLAVCTAWQLREVGGRSIVNTHDDALYDKEVIDRLGRLHEDVEPICSELAGALARFDGYGPRLSGALARVQSGEPEYFTKPMIPSYHSVWFELHEDLLATLGLERASEGS